MAHIVDELPLLVGNGRPVDPVYAIVLAVGIVVTTLGATEFISRQQHWSPLGKQDVGQHVTTLAAAQGGDLRIVGWPFDAIVMTEVFVVAVLVVLPVGFVVPLVVADRIRQGETVVTGDEIDAGPRFAPVLFEQVGGAQQAPSEIRQDPLVSPPEAPDRIPKVIVPLRPAHREISQLIAARPNVPGFGNQLDPGQHRILLDGIEKAAVGIEAVTFPSKGYRQVETKTIHVHLRDPIAQAVHHQLKDPRMGEIERIPHPSVIDIVTGIVLVQPVVRGIVDTPETERGAQLVALCSVVVNHVQYHLDTGIVQAPHHGLELRELGATQIAKLWGKEIQRVVSPVVAQSLFDQKMFIQKGMYRHQFHCGDAQRLQVGNHLPMAHAGKGPPLHHRDSFVQDGEPPHMGFVDDGLRPGRRRG